jgi:hypothetical protein
MRVLAAVLLVCLVPMTATATPPAQWHDSDWVKFIDSAVGIAVGEAASAAGSSVPIADVYSALSAIGSSTKTGLQLHLRRKIADAYAKGDDARGDRYNAFYSCLTWDECDEMRKIEKAHEAAKPASGSEGDVDLGGRFECADLSGAWVNSLDWLTTTWTLTPSGAHRYEAKEAGGCSAAGKATFDGSTLRIEWTCAAGYAGTYEWTLDASCSAGQGRLVYSKGGQGTHATKLKRNTTAN